MRCALVPFTAGSPGPPLAFRLRGATPTSLSPRQLPRQVLARAAQSRQPVVWSDLRAPSRETLGSTVSRQMVRSFMAVPVVYRGELLAVCYIDRFDGPRRFTAAEQASFSALAYELATPLLQLLEEQRRREYRELREALLAGPASFPGISSGSALEPLLERVRRLAPFVDENLLIVGETGTGKEVIAREIHQGSGRSLAPFVAINVSALSSELFQSELFGSVRGAFTGAVDRHGRIAQAEGGTLFLDEIGDLSLANQVKLLRFLQEKRYGPIGSTQERTADVRVIAATNRRIDDLVREGAFRADLLHRFAPPLVVPPLRERRDEILPHALRWLESSTRRRGMAAAELTPEAAAFLLEHPWPGNLRQLEAVLSHAVLVAPGRRLGKRLLEELAPLAPLGGGRPAVRAPSTWREMRDRQEGERMDWLVRELEADAGNVEATARRIQCPASTLRNALRRHRVRVTKGSRRSS